jgi:hypothetical protein
MLTSASAEDKAVTLDWAAPAQGTADDYILYYDQSGKAQQVTSLDCGEGDCLSYTDSGLTNGQTYCYKVTASNTECESAFSNIRCATPQPPGQVQEASVAMEEIGHWVLEGRGRNKYPVFQASTTFYAGDEIVVRLRVTDANGDGIGGAQALISITGPESVNLQASASDGQGGAEVRWPTARPNKKGIGGTATGVYTATVTGLSSATYEWDGAASTVNFSLVRP